MLRRRREGRTDYGRRLKLLTSRKIRCVVRLTERNSIVQMVEYRETKDFVRTGATSRELTRFGWDRGTSSVPAAYLAGYLSGKKALAIEIREAILDFGFVNPRDNERVRACARGLIDSGIEIPFNLEVDEERIKGKHTSGEDLFNRVREAIDNAYV